VVPAHNEADNIPPLMEEFLDMIARTRMNGGVILVNDCSADATFSDRLLER